MADAVLVGSVDAARDAAIEAAGDASVVGSHRAVHEAGDGIATHTFACELPGYHGWVWEVAVARAPDADQATICEAHLIPADDALLAPPWVPYEERVRPGDLEPGMTLPFVPEDPRLVPGLTVTDDDECGRDRPLGTRARPRAGLGPDGARRRRRALARGLPRPDGTGRDRRHGVVRDLRVPPPARRFDAKRSSAPARTSGRCRMAKS